MKNNPVKILLLFLIILVPLFLSSCTSLQTNASLKKEIDSLKLELEKTNNELENVRNRQEKMEHRLASHQKFINNMKNDNLVGSKKEAVIVKKNAYTKPILLYKKGRSALLEEKYDNAIKLFTRFLKKYPNNDLADNALYWTGECYYAVADFPKAITTFKMVVDKYPRGMKVPDALLKTAYSYLSLKDKAQAHRYLKLVVEKYPFSEASEKAQLKLKSFQ